VSRKVCNPAIDAGAAPLFSFPLSDDLVGQPVSAMYIFGEFDKALATSTLNSLKKEAVHPAAASAVVLANQGWTLDSWRCEKKEKGDQTS